MLAWDLTIDKYGIGIPPENKDLQCSESVQDFQQKNPQKSFIHAPFFRIIGPSKVLLKKEAIMNVRIEDNCTACGLCVDTCPDVFEMGDEIAEVIVDEVPAELEDLVQQAADECPVEAIVVE
jgi:ferredoxin